MKLPRLFFITDWRAPRDRLTEVLDAILPLGPAVAVQHRHPEAPTRVFLEEAQWLFERCARHHNPLFINDRLDVALLLGAHLHLPTAGVSVSQARRHLPADRLVSVAVHSEEEREAAAGADFALVSPVFGAGSKPGDSRPPLGVDGFHSLAAGTACAPVALGGVDASNAASLRGAMGFAVVSALLRAAAPEQVARALIKVASASTREPRNAPTAGVA